MLDKSLTVAERERRIEKALEDIFPLENFRIENLDGTVVYRAIVPDVREFGPVPSLPVSLLAKELEKALS